MPLLILPKSALLREPRPSPDLPLWYIPSWNGADTCRRKARLPRIPCSAKVLQSLPPKVSRQFPGKTQFFRRPAEIFHGSLLFPGVIGHQIDGNLVLQRAALIFPLPPGIPGGPPPYRRGLFRGCSFGSRPPRCSSPVRYSWAVPPRIRPIFSVVSSSTCPWGRRAIARAAAVTAWMPFSGSNPRGLPFHEL